MRGTCCLPLLSHAAAAPDTSFSLVPIPHLCDFVLSFLSVGNILYHLVKCYYQLKNHFLSVAFLTYPQAPAHWASIDFSPCAIGRSTWACLFQADC